jgi:hypothetical protein
MQHGTSSSWTYSIDRQLESAAGACRFPVQKHAAWTCSIDIGMKHGYTAGICSEEIQHGNEALTWHSTRTDSMDIKHVYVARTEQAALRSCIDMQYWHAALTCTFDMQQGHVQQGHTAWTCSINAE